MIEPIRVPFSGIVQADATFSIQITPAALQAFYGMILASVRQLDSSGRVLGAPQWTFSAGGTALDFSVGSSVDLGPRLISPGETITISGTGAQVGATISGVLHGTRGDSAAALMSGAYVPTPSVLGVQPTGTTTLIADITCPASSIVTKTVPTPSTATAVGYISTLNSGLSPGIIEINGVTTGQSYLFHSNTNQGVITTFFVPFVGTDVADKQLQCIVNNSIEGYSSRVQFFASTMPIANFVTGQVGLVGAHVTVDPGTFPFNAIVDASVPFNTEFTLVGNTNPLNAIAMGPLYYSSDAASKVVLLDGSGGAEVGLINYQGNSTAPTVMPYGGVKLTFGNPLIAKVTFGSANVTLQQNYGLIFEF